jgi:hypothetical protein
MGVRTTVMAAGYSMLAMVSGIGCLPLGNSDSREMDEKDVTAPKITSHPTSKLDRTEQ